MPIIKLNAIDSTNNFLKALSFKESVEDFTVVTAKYQTDGKGQMGASWVSEASKNLMFSVFVNTTKHKLKIPFYISIVTALALRKTLNQFLIPQVSIKWPNDILSQKKKICGVLIENVMKQNMVNASIIGVGLNVNQTIFKDLPNASSLKLIMGNAFNVDEILDTIIFNLKYYFLLLKQNKLRVLKEEYESYLFRKNKPSTFKNADDNLFSGYIKSVSDCGDLQVLLEDNITANFSLKEITLLY